MPHTRRVCTLLLVLFLLFPTLFSCGNGTPEFGALTLAQNGKSNYRVIISETASNDVRTMADEFVGYFEKITGVTPPIESDVTPAEDCEIVLGKTTRAIDSAVQYNKLQEEELVYFVNGKTLLLTGATDRAVAYAIYGFLEDYCGVRYWSANYEYIPQNTTLEIPGNLLFTDKPVFWYRSMNEAGSSDEKWMVKMRLNSRQSLGSERFRLNPFVGGGHGYADWFVHTIGKLAEMQNDYPNRTSFMNLQPCLSSEETYQTVLKNVRAWLEQYPDANLISISQNDGSANTMCTCADCSELYYRYGMTQSAKWIWFVSKIANELKDEYPDVYFDTLAYNFTLNAPSNIEVPNNVIVRLVPAHACINHNYKNCRDSKNSSASQTSEQFHKAMEEWSEIAEHRFIWDYDALFYNFLAPFTNFHYVRENIHNYATDGVEGVFLQGDSTGSNGFAELRAYLAAKCLWDPYITEEEYDALMREFMEGYYGPGTSEPLTEYVDFVNARLSNNHYTLYAYMHNSLLPVDTLTDDNGTIHLNTAATIEPLNAFFDRAEKNVTDEKQKLHLRKARMQVKYHEVMCRFWIIYEGENVVIDYETRRKLNESLYEDAVACGIEQLSEGQRLTPTPNLNYAPLYWDRK